MREIKFRAWFKNEGEMKNVAINNVYEGNKTYLHLSPLPMNDYKPIDLMQYTGLKDKNGREIYEGDVIRFTNGIDEVYEEVGTVVFDLEECGYKAQYIDDGVTRCIYLINPKVFADKYMEITYEILGNIYENPELLEVK